MSNTSDIRTAAMTVPTTGQRYTAYFCAANHPHTCRHDAAACNRVAEREAELADPEPTSDRPLPILQGLMDELLGGGR